ncbi:MAG: hypothetical protein BMS9Abin15_0135 [Gammaproteobacteria bacterium]|nr:MAG: hypothetical protein BMS9Abin15_0135 [Gammaproteobacteria bacterium]
MVCSSLINKKLGDQYVPFWLRHNRLFGRFAHACLIASVLVWGSVSAQLPPAEPADAAVVPEELGPAYPELEPRPGVYIVPPVVERPLGIEEGPRIKIIAFELRGATDRPDQGLKLDDVYSLINEERSKRPDGLTIGQLQELANRITDHYRKNGFIVSYAFIPVQTVEDGVVVIQVLEGVLGQVLVEGNKMYSPDLLASPFDPLMGQPLTLAEVESSLVRLADYPGLTVFGVFQPGQKVGDSDLILKVQKEDRTYWKLSYNNHGSTATGQYAARLDFGINNIFGAADRLEVGVQQKYDPKKSNLKSWDYERMLFRPQYRLLLHGESNEFKVRNNDDGGAINSLDITGRGDSFMVAIRNDYERTRTSNAYAMLSLTRASGRSLQRGRTLTVDDLTIARMEWNKDWIDLKSQGLNLLTVQYSRGIGNFLGSMESNDPQDPQVGSRRGGSGTKAGGKFNKISINYSRLQTMGKNTSLLVRLGGQFSNDLLFSGEQFAMGGPDSVRAYVPSQFLTDSGGYFTAEYLMNAPGFTDTVSPFKGRRWGEVLQASIFLDYAHGAVNDPLSSQQKNIELIGYGFGLNFNLPGEFQARWSAGIPLSGRRPADGDEPQFFFDVTAHF